MKKLILLLIPTLLTITACDNKKPQTDSEEEGFATLEEIFEVFNNGSFELTSIEEYYNDGEKDEADVIKQKLHKEANKLEFLDFNEETSEYETDKYLYLEELEDNYLFHRYSKNSYDTWYEEVVDYDDVSDYLYNIDMLYEMFEDIQNGGTEDYNVEWVYDNGVYQATVDMGPNEGITTVTVTLSRRFFKSIKRENVKGDFHEDWTITANNVGKTKVELPNPLINDVYHDFNQVGLTLLEQSSYKLEFVETSFHTGDEEEKVTKETYEVIQKSDLTIIKVTKEDKDPFIVMKRIINNDPLYYISTDLTSWVQYTYYEYSLYNQKAILGSYFSSFTEEYFLEFISVIPTYEPGHFTFGGPQENKGEDEYSSVYGSMTFDGNYILKNYTIGSITHTPNSHDQITQVYDCSGVGITSFDYPALP